MAISLPVLLKAPSLAAITQSRQQSATTEPYKCQPHIFEEHTEGSMCTGKTTNLVCGHQLLYFNTRCMAECSLPKGPIEMLQDTCADCDPSFQRRIINQEYNEMREDIMGKMRKAHERTQTQEEGRLAKISQDLDVERSLALAEINKLNLKVSGEVIWPGKKEHEHLFGASVCWCAFGMNAD